MKKIFFSLILFLLVNGLLLAEQAPITFDQSVIDLAVNNELTDFTGNRPGARPINVKASKAMYLLALAAWNDPESASTGGILVVNRLRAHIKRVITSGREPNADGAIEGWGHGAVMLSLAIARKIPVVWDELTELEQEKVDWLVKAHAVAGHYCFDDGNDYKRSISGGFVFDKSWNNNIGEGYFSTVIAGAIYFGHEEMDSIFSSFSYDEYMTKFEEYNWNFIIDHWSKGGMAKLETAVNRPFSYKTIPLSDLGTMMAQRVQDTHAHIVTNQSPSGKAFILNDGSSPVLGEPGMIQELNHSDGSGERSDLLYAYETWMNAIPNVITVKLFDVWGEGATQDDADIRVSNGSRDLVYKMVKGYRSYSNGSFRDIYQDENSDNRWDTPISKGYLYVKEAWTAILKDTEDDFVDIKEVTGSIPARIWYNENQLFIDNAPGAHLVIYDTLGRQIRKVHSINQHETINLHGLRNGVYIVTLFQGNDTASFKVMFDNF